LFNSSFTNRKPLRFVVSTFGVLCIVSLCAAKISSGILPFQTITDFLFNVVRLSKLPSFSNRIFYRSKFPSSHFLSSERCKLFPLLVHYAGLWTTIIQKKAYDIQNTAKVWNQEYELKQLQKPELFSCQAKLTCSVLMKTVWHVMNF